MEISLNKDSGEIILNVAEKKGNFYVAGILGAFLDDNIDVRTVLSDAAYHIFIDQYSTDILKLLDNIEVAKFQHMNLIKNRFKKILDLALKKLIEKSDKTKSIEYAYLRLKDASGMIEYSEKKDLVEIGEILKSMFPQETEEEISNRMNTIISRLQNDLIYDLYKSYRLSITLSSNGILSLLITHDSKVSKDNNAGYHFHLTYDTDTIVSILSRYAYSDDSVDGVFTKVIDADTSFNSDIDDCDYV